MKILGIDPGYAIVGYGVIDFSVGRYISNGFGAIITNPKDSFARRLEIIFNSIAGIIQQYNPDTVAIEKLYFQTNQKTAIEVAEARGVIILSAQKFSMQIYEYTPLQVKSAVTGYGKAQKEQVMAMTQRILGLDKIPKPDDTADALAVAICHANCSGSFHENQIPRREIYNS